MGRWWPQRGALVLGKGGRLWGIILTYFRRANEEPASPTLRGLLLYSRRTRASGDWIWELGVGSGGTGHPPSCGQPPLRDRWGVLSSGCCGIENSVIPACWFVVSTVAV